MANRDYDDRDRDRGGRGGHGRDDRDDHGRDYGQGGRLDERGGFDRRDQWVGGGGNHGGGTGGGGFSRGGMSPGGGAYGRGNREEDRDRSQDRGRGDMGSVNFGGGRGYDNFGGGAFRAGAEFAAREDERSRDRDGYGRGEDERLGRPRGAQGGAFGSGGERDYGDHRSDRDRSLLGGIGSMLGFGQGRRDEDRGSRQDHRQDRGQGGFREAAQGFGPERRGMGPRGYVRSDARIEEEVNERLSHGHLDATDVEVKVGGGEVTLAGTVRSRGDKRLAEDLADDVMGVRHVQNNLRVQDNWTAGGSAPGFGGGAGRGPVDGPVVGGTGSASNVTTGQDASQMAGQSPGQASTGSGNAGHSGEAGAKDEPGRL